MRKRRSWLIGLGLGIALGAALLQLMNAAQSPAGPTRLPNEPLSLEELKKQSTAKGYSLVRSGTGEGKTYSQEELDAAVAAAKKEAAPAGQGSAEGAEKAGSDAEAGSSDDAAAQPKTLYIWQHATLQEVAHALEGLGLVDDKAAFIKRAKPYAGKLRVGLCTFSGQPTYDQIIEELTRGKN